MIVAYRTEGKAFFLYGFAKNERENIEDSELQTLRDIGGELLAQSNKALDEADLEGLYYSLPPLV